MIPNHEPNTLVTSGEEVAAFGISHKDEAHVLGILRDQIYSDKVLAVVREYCTNAWDANRAAKRGDVPIAVHLPTFEEPYLAVEDFGPGLSPSDVAEVFTKYGASTKRGSDDQVGMLGIGSKSAFSYATSFTVVSRFDSEKRTYVCALDESDLGTVTLLSSEACGPDTGVEVRVAVRPGDIDQFRDRAANLFEHFHPRPNCGDLAIPTAPSDRITLTHDDGRQLAWVDDGSSCTAVMGCVPYDVDLGQLELPEELEWATKAALTLHFPIGAVQFAASREELRYTEKTKEAILGALADVTDQLVARVLVEIEAEQTNAFARRLKIRQLSRFDLPLPAEYEDLAKGYIQLVDKYDEQIPFTLNCRGNQVGWVVIERTLRFLVQDAPNKITGYNLGDHDYVVVPRDKTEVGTEAARVAIASHILANGLEGAPVVNLSTVPWTRPWNARKSGAKLPGSAARYKANVLVLERDPGDWSSALSSRWIAVRHDAGDDDIWVPLQKFEVYGGESFYSSYKLARQVLRALGEDVPVVYGYKVGKTPAPAIGTGFDIWWKDKLRELLARADVKAALFAYEARECLPQLYGGVLPDLRAALGDGHPLVAPYVAAKSAVLSWASDLYRLSNYKMASAPALKGLLHALRSYPLLESMNTFNPNYGGSPGKREHWIDYVKLIDERAQRAIEDAAAAERASWAKADPEIPNIFDDVPTLAGALSEAA